MAEKTDNFESGLQGAAQTVAQFDAPQKSLLSRFQSALHKSPSLVPLIVLVCAIMIFSGWLGPRFLPQMTLVFQQIQIVGILALAQTLVILTAGIDLSVGAIAVFCSVIIVVVVVLITTRLRSGPGMEIVIDGSDTPSFESSSSIVNIGYLI